MPREESEHLRGLDDSGEIGLELLEDRLEEVVAVIGIVETSVLGAEVQGVAEPDDVMTGQARRRALVARFQVGQGGHELGAVRTAVAGQRLYGNSEDAFDLLDAGSIPGRA